MTPTRPRLVASAGRLRQLVQLLAVAGVGLVPISQRPTRPPVVLLFAVGDSVVPADAEVPLIHRVAGERPTHYRLDHRPDFADATWLPYQDQPRWRAARSGSEPPCRGRPAGLTVRLYFQVRSVLGEQVRVVDGRRVVVPLTSESNVQSATICVTPEGG